MPYRLPAIAATLLVALLCSGCHTAITLLPPNLRPPSVDTTDALKLAQEKLRQASPCCSSFADFSYRNLLPWQPQKFHLGSASMVANLNGTPSYFLAFRLPSGMKLPYRIALKSELNGRWLHTSYLFAPTIVLLDAGFQPIHSEDIGLCEHMGWSDETTGAFGSMKIDSKQARYLLVYSSATQQAGKTYWEQSPASFSTTTAATLQMNSAGSFSIPHGPDGVLWIGIMNTTYEKAVDKAVCGKPAKGNGVLEELPLPWIGSGGKTR
ncbi:MAG TPA: MalM family protein [Rhodanobacter sp.]|nr:MalM family protein [Rhodanobacter sp.]